MLAELVGLLYSPFRWRRGLGQRRNNDMMVTGKWQQRP